MLGMQQATHSAANDYSGSHLYGNKSCLFTVYIIIGGGM